MRYDRLLEGKRCVVTSGAHGLGYAIARLFARHGGAVAVCGKAASGAAAGAALAALSPGSFFTRCDLSRPEETEAFAGEVCRRWGGADVLVCCAGINRKAPVEQITPEDFQQIQAVNLRSALCMIQRLLPGMYRQGSGSIVCISSMNSLAPSPGTGAYVMSKGGVEALCRVLAVEGGEHGVRANAICPGWIATTYLREDIRAAGGGQAGAAQVLGALRNSAPCLSPARAEDIANHALFLASELSAYVTGQLLRSDGGAVLQERPYAYPQPEETEALHREWYASILREMADTP